MNTVLITGASAGIGKTFAEHLARQGFSLILVARREKNLRELADILTRKYGVAVHVIAIDLAESDAASRLEKQVLSITSTLNGVINNAGFGLRGSFDELDRTRQLSMIQLNVNVLVDITHRFIPVLAGEHPFIINVASSAGFQPGPGMAIYYATKAFVLSFTEALHEELINKDIHVSALCPGATESEFADVADMHNTLLFKAGAMKSDDVVSESLRLKHKAVVVPGLKNKFGVFSVRLSPRWLVRKIVKLIQS